MDNIVRKPIQVQHHRRSEFNPEFLDLEFLLEKYKPLFKSLQNYFSSYNGILNQPVDIEDLYSQIQLEFIKLAQKYDPRRGVDFPGYIKFNLQYRVYYYIVKLQRRQRKEYLLLPFEESDDVADIDSVSQFFDSEDLKCEFDLFKVESMESIPWDKIKDESDRSLILQILDHRSFSEIAKSQHKTIKAVKDQFETLCNKLIRHCNQKQDPEGDEEDGANQINNSGAERSNCG